MKINTVIFDIGGVLVGLSGIRFFRSFGYPEEVCRGLSDATFESPYWKEFDRAVLSEQEVIEKFVENTPHLEEEIRECMENVHGIIFPLETSTPWIEEVKEMGLRTLFLSNYSQKVVRDNLDAMTFMDHLDGGLMSCDCHLIKPDPAFYEALIREYDLEPEKCVFLDDTQENLDTARTFGLNTILVKNYEQASRELRELLAG